MRDLKYEVEFFTWIDIPRSNKLIGLSLEWLDMAKVIQNDKSAITPGRV